jgi:hypothetical protein
VQEASTNPQDCAREPAILSGIPTGFGCRASRARATVVASVKQACQWTDFIAQPPSEFPPGDAAFEQNFVDLGGRPRRPSAEEKDEEKRKQDHRRDGSNQENVANVLSGHALPLRDIGDDRFLIVRPPLEVVS